MLHLFLLSWHRQEVCGRREKKTFEKRYWERKTKESHFSYYYLHSKCQSITDLCRCFVHFEHDSEIINNVCRGLIGRACISDIVDVSLKLLHMRSKEIKSSRSELGFGIFINDPIRCFTGNSPRCGRSICEFFLLTLKKSRLDQCLPTILCKVVVKEDADYVCNSGIYCCCVLQTWGVEGKRP